MNPERLRSKAQSFRGAWLDIFNEEPSMHCIALGCAVAEHETHCGDSWPGENDWGATTLRALNAQELAVLSAAGIRPTVGPGHVEAAEKAMAALKASGLPLPPAVIHCDSHPAPDGKGSVPYFVWFASFDSERKG